MKHWPPPAPRKPRRRRVPAFHPVPVGARRDGWTPARQAGFIGMLAETGSVLAAARFVSMSRESAYRLRKRPGAAGFAAAWDAALGHEVATVRGGRVKVTGLPAGYRLETGLLQVNLYAGRYRGFIRKTDSCGLLKHLSTLDRALRGWNGGERKSHQFRGDRASTLSPCTPHEPRGPAPFKQAGAASRSA